MARQKKRAPAQQPVGRAPPTTTAMSSGSPDVDVGPTAALPDLPRICILDADDSYTHSIVKLISDVYPDGSEARKQVDERVIVLRERDVGYANLVKVLPEFAAVILGPGPGRPEPELKDASPSPTLTTAPHQGEGGEDPATARKFNHPAELFTHLLAEQLLPVPIPTLGICLGHQALACAFGGRVVQAPRILHGQICRLQLEPSASADGSVLKTAKEGERVVRYNSLTVDPASVGGKASELDVTAWAVDVRETERSVMALQHRSLPYWSVQYHPESVCSDNGKALITSFLRLVAASDHVNSTLTRPKAFSALPPELLRVSRICNPFNSTHSNIFAFPVENQITPFFELRTRPLGRPGPSPHLPQDVFEVLVKGQTPLGEVWLDSSRFPLPPRPDFAAAAKAAKEEKERANGKAKENGIDPPTTNGTHQPAANGDAAPDGTSDPVHAANGTGPNGVAPNGKAEGPAVGSSNPFQAAADIPWPPPGDHNCRFSHMASTDVLVSYFSHSRSAWVANTENHRTRLPLQGIGGASNFWTWLSGAQEIISGLTRVCDVGESKWVREDWDERVKRGEKPGQDLLDAQNAAKAAEAGEGPAKDPAPMAVDPKEGEKSVAVNGQDGEAGAEGPTAMDTDAAAPDGHPWADPNSGAKVNQRPEIPLPPVGWIGYLGYELASESLDGHRLRTRGLPEMERTPDAEMGFSFCAFTYDHVERQWYMSLLVRLEQNITYNSMILIDALERRLGTRLGFSEDEYAAFMDAQEQTFIIEEEPEVMLQQQEEIAREAELQAAQSYRPLHLRPLKSEIEYQTAVERAQQQIAEGESYELCLTTTFKSTLQRRKGAGHHHHHPKQDAPKPEPAKPDPAKPDQPECVNHDVGSHFPLYLKLREANPAPHSAYMHFSPFDTSILSSSPERFMRIDRFGNVEMKPIKGTARRRLDSDDEDKKVVARLKGDLKERAECLMITDLIRHDLLRFCEVESVKVPKLIRVETNATVHNLVSTVVGKLKPGFNTADALKMAFPPGSMTGAPKLRSVELLDELEEGRPRGVYSGVLGYMAVDGTADWSVVIRTAVIREKQLTIGAGGAITALSRSDHEWEEVLTKVAAVGDQLSA